MGGELGPSGNCCSRMSSGTHTHFPRTGISVGVWPCASELGRLLELEKRADVRSSGERKGLLLLSSVIGVRCSEALRFPSIVVYGGGENGGEELCAGECREEDCDVRLFWPVSSMVLCPALTSLSCCAESFLASSALACFRAFSF